MTQKQPQPHEYSVHLMCLYSDTVTATSPEEAADLVSSDCPYDVDGPAFVVDLETGEEFDGV